MPHLPEDRLALVRKLYEASELTIAEIAILADVSESAIYQRARREQWATARRPGVSPRRQKRRPPLAPTPALQALAGEAETGLPEGDPREAGAPSPAGDDDIDRAATAGRLWRAIDRHLRDLHAQDAAADTIRAAQNLAALARTLQTLVDVERGLQRDRGPLAPPLDEGPVDIDEFRNEIARRIENLCREADD